MHTRNICIRIYYLLCDDLTIFCITTTVLWLFVILHSGHFERIFSACLRRSAKTFASLQSGRRVFFFFFAASILFSLKVNVILKSYGNYYFWQYAMREQKGII